MAKILAIAWREFRFTALTKAFIIGSVIVPVLMWAAFPLIAALVEDTVPPLRGTLAIVDPTGEVAAAAAVELDAGRLAAERARRRDTAQAEIRRIPDDPGSIDPAALEGLSEEDLLVELSVEAHEDGAALEALKAQVREGALVAVAEVDPAALDAPEVGAPRPEGLVRLYVPAGIKADHTQIIEDELADAVVRARAARQGLDADELHALARSPRITSRALSEGGGETKDVSVIKKLLPFGFLLLLWITTFTGGNYLLTTTIEEKSNKLMEVLLSAVSPLQLMTGKILGQGLVALVMLVMYSGLLLVALVAFATLELVPLLHWLYLVLFFVMAYFYVATLMAAIGSAVNDLHEAQALMTPAMLVLFAPLALMIFAAEDPNGPVATITSIVPPLSPFLMMVRLTADTVPTWQILLALALGVAAVAAALWACAKIFRVGVLLQGKPPTPWELVRWLRYS